MTEFYTFRAAFDVTDMLIAQAKRKETFRGEFEDASYHDEPAVAMATVIGDRLERGYHFADEVSYHAVSALRDDFMFASMLHELKVRYGLRVLAGGRRRVNPQGVVDYLILSRYQFDSPAPVLVLKGDDCGCCGGNTMVIRKTDLKELVKSTLPSASSDDMPWSPDMATQNEIEGYLGSLYSYFDLDEEEGE